MPDPSRPAALLGLAKDEPPLLVLTFGYPIAERDPQRRSVEERSRRADRKPPLSTNEACTIPTTQTPPGLPDD